MHQASSPKHQHIAALDLLRLVSALAVLAFHYLFRGSAADGYLSWSYPDAAPYAIYGSLGVRQFFLISGFVIAWSAEGRTWQAFAASRIVRLYPGFVICMTMTFLVCLVAASPVFPVTFGQYLANLTMVSRIFHEPFMDGAYWSIVLEIIFYGWVFLALLAGIFEKWKLELLAGWLAISIVNEFWLGSGALRLVFITTYSGFFVAGVLLHHMMSKGRSPEALLLYAASLLMSALSVLDAQRTLLADYGSTFPMAAVLPATLAMHGVIILAVLRPALVKASPLMLALGGLTYPLYLLHQHIGYLAIEALAPRIGKWPAFALTAAVLVALAWTVWRFAEKPLQRRFKPLVAALVDRIGDGATRLRSRVFSRRRTA